LCSIVIIVVVVVVVIVVSVVERKKPHSYHIAWSGYRPPGGQKEVRKMIQYLDEHIAKKSAMIKHSVSTLKVLLLLSAC
jgi:hypothetical protein